MLTYIMFPTIDTILQCCCYCLKSRLGQRILIILGSLLSLKISEIISSLIFSMFIFERERESAQAGEGQRERETQNLKQSPGSELSAQSPTRGLNSRT